MPDPTDPAPPSPPESILVHGRDETGVSALAAGMALRHLGSFAWADCARSAPMEDLPVHWIFARGSDRPAVDRVEPSILELPSWTPPTLHRLLVLDNATEGRRLASYLSLPELFQRLASRTPDRDGRVAVVLANVNAIPAGSHGAALEHQELHQRLHDAGITLFATSLAPPPSLLLSAFDRVFRIDVAEGESWANGALIVEKGGPADDRAERFAIRDAWHRLDLDPSLLPPL